MKHLRKFNENMEQPDDNWREDMLSQARLQMSDVSLYDALESYHGEEHVDSECHTALDNFVSWLEDNFDYKITKK